ncbi:MAG TPA: hypothetical protein VIO57_15755, partial [Chloroflexota bacterium]
MARGPKVLGDLAHTASPTERRATGGVPVERHDRRWSDERVRAPARVDHEGRRYNGWRVCGG